MSLASLSDPAGSSALVAAVSWLESTVLGTVATSLAVTAVAWVGLLLLMGRLEVRRGMTVIAGCFVLFGASAIAGGVRDAVGAEVEANSYTPPAVAAPLGVPAPRRNPDPYAGASMPSR